MRAVYQKFWQTTIPSVIPIIAESIFSDLIHVHPCTRNLMHGVWSPTTKAAGSEVLLQRVSYKDWNWQKGILKGLELYPTRTGIGALARKGQLSRLVYLFAFIKSLHLCF